MSDIDSRAEDEEQAGLNEFGTDVPLDFLDWIADKVELIRNDKRFCSTCKHVTLTVDGYMCKSYRAGNRSLDVVTGEMELVSCYDQRMGDDQNMCGYWGRFWEKSPEGAER